MKRTRNFKVEYSLSSAIRILEKNNNKILSESQKVRESIVDHFLYRGKFNSVLGLDGFQNFKTNIKDVIKSVNAEDFGANYINLDEMFEVLLRSGIYYKDDYLPAELNHLKQDIRWLTAYRYIAKNFSEITYKDYREIVKRLEDTKGRSILVSANDSEFFKQLPKTNLFHQSKDALASYVQMSQAELRVICKQLGIQGARSIEETATRIIQHLGEDSLKFLPENVASGLTLTIKDQELATGEDLIKLDDYLRAISKVVREDLAEFINSRRWGTLVA